LILKVKIFTAGGTIDKIYFDQKNDYQVGNPAIENIMSEGNVRLPFETETLIMKDSLDITEEDRKMIVGKLKRSKFERIVITHGTDTMAQTAEILKKEIKDKTIVMTGSMTPAKFKESDAVFNVGFALSAAQTLKHGVYIAMNGKIFKAGNVKKNIKKNCFEEIKK
jgi:L-asparaginase